MGYVSNITEGGSRERAACPRERMCCGRRAGTLASPTCAPLAAPLRTQAGMSWVLQHVKAHGWRGVVNMSLGSGKIKALNDAAQYVRGREAWGAGPGIWWVAMAGGPPGTSATAAVALATIQMQLIYAGIPVIAAAGNNEGADACTMSPASSPNAVAVASSEEVWLEAGVVHKSSVAPAASAARPECCRSSPPPPKHHHRMMCCPPSPTSAP